MSETGSAILWEKKGDITVVRFTLSELRENEESRRAGEELKQLALGTGGKMILSLRSVGYVASSGVATLILFNRLLRSMRGHVKLCDVQPLVLKTLVAAGVNQVLDIHGTEDEAMAVYLADTETKAEN